MPSPTSANQPGERLDTRRQPPTGLDAVPAFLRGSASHRAARSMDGDAGQGRAPSADGPPSDVAHRPDRQTASVRAPGRATLDPGSLPLPAISRRRLATAAAALAVIWVVLAFGRQVGQAAVASDRADELRQANAELRQGIADLQSSLAMAQDERFIKLEGRAVGLGGRGEIPFTLAADAPTLAPDAPGSASVRIGAETRPVAPLESWLKALFGPSP